MCVLSQGQYLMPLSLNCLPISSATPWWAIVSSNRSWLDWKRSPDPRQLPRFTLSNVFSRFLISLRHIFSFSCKILSHFLEFKGRRPQILKKHSATFLIIFTYLQILYSRLYFCSRSYESLRISYQSPLEWEVCNGDDCLKPGICLLHLQANVMHSGRSGIYLNEYRGMTSSKSMVDIRS